MSDSVILVEGVAAPETRSAVTDESDEELVQLMVSLRNYYSQKQSDSDDQELTQLMGKEQIVLTSDTISELLNEICPQIR